MRRIRSKKPALCCFFLLIPIPALFFIFACGTNPPHETPLPAGTPVTHEPGPVRPGVPGGMAEEIRNLVETGSPSLLREALDILRSRELGNTEFGRIMNGVIGALSRTLYPEIQIQLPPLDIPQNHVYARILRDNARGVYTSYPASEDYLEQVLPFLALYNNTNASSEALLAALPDLEKGTLNKPDSVLAPFFLAYVYEHSGQINEAHYWYTMAWALSNECYPAALGLARLMGIQGRAAEAAGFLSDLALRFPDNQQIKRSLAIAYYRAGDWQAAEQAVSEILQRDTRDGEFILMRAHIFVETGRLLQAQAPLDIYAGINPNNRLFLFLRARVQFEGFRNREAALGFLRTLIRNQDGDIDDEITVYAIQLLLESNQEADRIEGRNLLQRFLVNPTSSLSLITLALQDAVRRESWTEAHDHLNRLLAERRSNQDLLNAYTVEKEQGNTAAALAYARELYERDPSFEEGAIAFITALIDADRIDEASRMIEPLLGNAASGTQKSRYYYLRSRTMRNEEAIMNELRSSLFEDPRNLNALIAIFEIYHNRRDERRAIYYLRQALALASDNPVLRRYEAEYAALLGNM